MKSYDYDMTFLQSDNNVRHISAIQLLLDEKHMIMIS